MASSGDRIRRPAEKGRSASFSRASDRGSSKAYRTFLRSAIKNAGLLVTCALGVVRPHGGEAAFRPSLRASLFPFSKTDSFEHPGHSPNSLGRSTVHGAGSFVRFSLSVSVLPAFRALQGAGE